MENALGAVVSIGVIRVILGMESAQPEKDKERGQGSRKEKSRAGGRASWRNRVPSDVTKIAWVRQGKREGFFFFLSRSLN